MVSKQTPKRKISKRVNLGGYYNKYGTKVGPYKKTFKKYPNHYFTELIDPNTGQKRLAEVWVKGKQRRYKWVDDRRKLRSKKPLYTYTRFDQFAKSSESELLELAKQNNIHIDLNESVIKSEVIYKLLDHAEEMRFQREIRKESKQELLSFVTYLKGDPSEFNKYTKEQLVNYIKDFKSSHITWKRDYETTNTLSNNAKFAIRLLSKEYLEQSGSKGYQARLDREYLVRLVGENVVDTLENEGIISPVISSNEHDINCRWLTNHGRDVYNANQNAFKELKNPHYIIMQKEIPSDVMQSTKALSKNKREYAIAIDFERELENPQQIVAVQGAETFTYRLGDFEFFGHTHPSRYDPHPSTGDLVNMVYGKPEFIVAGLTGKAIIINIEDYNKYYDWLQRMKQESKTNKDYFHYDYWSHPLFDLNKKVYRDKFFENTGINVYPYKKGMVISLINDPKLEKRFPLFSQNQLDIIAKSQTEGEPKKIINER